ncbi:MAG TPA: hypothetical protein QGH84_10230 [Rhodospirillales bacterium]|nr:hypothetical protein [Rhodospirillales bacterium]
MDSLPVILFLALIAAAVVLRRRINDPASAFGRWWARTIQSWYDRHADAPLELGFKVIIFLTVILWVGIFLNSSGKESSGLGDLFKGVYQSGSGDEKK